MSTLSEKALLLLSAVTRETLAPSQSRDRGLLDASAHPWCPWRSAVLAMPTSPSTATHISQSLRPRPFMLGSVSEEVAVAVGPA